MSPSGASQHKAEGVHATRSGAAWLVPSLMTHKRDGECTKAAPREAQHTWKTAGTDSKGVEIMKAALGTSEPVHAGKGDRTIMVWRGPGMQGDGSGILGARAAQLGREARQI